jgi:hypothetical protein
MGGKIFHFISFIRIRSRSSLAGRPDTFLLSLSLPLSTRTSILSSKSPNARAYQSSVIIIIIDRALSYTITTYRKTPDDRDVLLAPCFLHPTPYFMLEEDLDESGEEDVPCLLASVFAECLAEPLPAFFLSDPFLPFSLPDTRMAPPPGIQTMLYISWPRIESSASQETRAHHP